MNILIVAEDALRDSLENTLENIGFNTDSAKTCSEAATKARNTFYNLIFIDIDQPEDEWVELLTSIKGINEDMLSIVVTDDPTDLMVTRAMTLGAYSSIVKPFRKEQILPVLGKALEKQKLSIENKQMAEQLKAFNEEIKKRDQFKNEFVNIISNEVDRPLKYIKESVSMILDGRFGETTDQQNRFLEMSLKGIDREKQILDNLINLASIEADKVRLRKKKMDIVGLVEDVVSLYKSDAEAKDLEIKTDLPEEAIEINADSEKISQVIRSLLDNSLRLTEKGRIEVSVDDKGDFIECSVFDTGVGISDEDMPKVFDKMQFIGDVDSLQKKGVGLSLYVVRKIVQLHDGNIWVESIKGEYTRFIFTLPKYSEGGGIYDTIRKKLVSDKEEKKDFVVYLIRIENYKELQAKLGDEGIKNIFNKIHEGFESIVRSEDLIEIKDENEIVLLVNVGLSEMDKIGKRLSKVVKIVSIELEGSIEIDFSYGSAVSSVGVTAHDLIKEAEDKMVNDLTERLKRKIMIVDDEERIVTILKNILKGLGYSNIIEAYDGAEAIDKIAKENPDLVILDIVLPDISGYEIIGRLKEEADTKDMPILIMSGSEIEKGKIREYVKNRDVLTMKKPFYVSQIKKLVNYLL